VPEPFAAACCPAVLAGRLPRPGAVPACVFFRDVWPAAAAAPVLAAAGGLPADGFAADGFAAGGFAVAEPVEADGPVAPPGLAGADGFVDPGDFGATALAEAALRTADGLAGAGRADVAVAVPPPAGAAPGTGAG
jgi:hypothetical protein